jgi:LacI family transcriptional regulator
LKFRYAAARATGFEAAHRSRWLNPVPGLSVQTPMTEQSGYEQAIRLLSSAEPPTAILSGSIFMAQGVYRAIREKGLRPGRDVSVVAHDDQLRGIKANEFDPPLSATESSVRKAGERLAEILIDRVDTGAAEPVTEIWPVELIVRGSIAPPPRH